MALSPEYLEYTDKLFGDEAREDRHQVIMEQIETARAITEFSYMFMTLVVIGLLYWLVWIAVDNHTRYRITDDFERIEPPPIDWDKVESP